MTKIVFLDISTVGDVPNLKILEDFGTVTYYQHTTADEVVERVTNQNIVITNKVVIDRKIMQSCPSLKLICIAATGTNNVDLDAAEELGIVVRNVVDYSTQSVAQSTFAGLFYLLHQLKYYDEYVKQGNYSNSLIFTHINHNFWQLAGKTFGIIGLGNIGKTVAAIAKSFGSHVVYYSTSGKNFNKEYESQNLDQLLKESDIVSIHAPLNDRTMDLIDYKALQQMKRNAILINVGRGKIVNESDLAQALDEELIGAAFIDVMEKEPINASNPLLAVKNPEKLLITPHNTWASVESRTLLIQKTADNISEFLGQPN